MGAELNARSFRSGNSVAIRIPAALGVEPGIDWAVSEVNGDIVLRRKPAGIKYIDVSGFAGKAPGIKLAPREDFEERPSTIAALKAAGFR
jgi:antitoxin VapB